MPDDDGVDQMDEQWEVLDTGLIRANDQSIGRATPEEARELDARLREFDELRLRGEATSHTVYIGGRR